MVVLPKRSIFKVLEDVDVAVKKSLESISGRSWVSEVDVEDAYSCVLAEDVVARNCNPPFPRSVVDGYAVDYASVAGASEDNPVSVKLKARIRVYESAEDVEIGLGEAVEVDTGSMLPRNANAVIPVEYAEENGDVVRVYRSVKFGENVAWPCSDIAKEDIIMLRGSMLTPLLVGVAASQGYRRLKVVRPKTCIFSTGDELVEPGKPLRGGLIYDSNRFMLISLLRGYCVDILASGSLSDDFNEIVSSIKQCESKGADIIIFTGGTSAGIEDNVYRAIKEVGTMIVHGVKLKPGKPTAIGITAKKTLIIGLPGNPNSAFNVFINIVDPILREKSVSNIKNITSDLREIEVVLALPARVVKGRANFNPSFLLKGNGVIYAFPISYESYMITRLAMSDALIVVPEYYHEVLNKGEKTKALVLRGDWSHYRYSIVGEELNPRLVRNLAGSGEAKLILHGTGFAIPAIEKCVADVGIVGASFPGVGSLSPGCSFIEEYVTRRFVVLERNTVNKGYNRVALLPSSYSVFYKAKQILPSKPVYAASFMAARYLIERGYVEKAIVPADILREVDLSHNGGLRVAGEFNEKYLVFYRSPRLEFLVERIANGLE